MPAPCDFHKYIAFGTLWPMAHPPASNPRRPKKINEKVLGPIMRMRHVPALAFFGYEHPSRIDLPGLPFVIEPCRPNIYGETVGSKNETDFATFSPSKIFELQPIDKFVELKIRNLTKSPSFDFVAEPRKILRGW